LWQVQWGATPEIDEPSLTRIQGVYVVAALAEAEFVGHIGTGPAPAGTPSGVYEDVTV
jgi:hypothetical protein